MQTLPLEKIWQVALNLDPTSLLNFCRTNKAYAELCRSDGFWKNYFDQHPEVPENVENPMFWARKAQHDFGFPIAAFPFAGEFDVPARDRYLSVKNYLPSKENLLLLNQMAPQWNQYKNKWQLVLDYPMEPTLYHDKNLQSLPPMTQDEANDFLDGLEDQETDEFIKSMHLYLTLDYSITRPWDRVFKQRVNLEAPRRTLIRGDNDENVTYGDILNNTRNLFPDITWGVINQYIWNGFSPDGIPQLKVKIGF